MYMYKKDLALNNLHKTKPNQSYIAHYIYQAKMRCPK